MERGLMVMCTCAHMSSLSCSTGHLESGVATGVLVGGLVS